jgi:hypothetical protein
MSRLLYFYLQLSPPPPPKKNGSSAPPAPPPPLPEVRGPPVPPPLPGDSAVGIMNLFRHLLKRAFFFPHHHHNHRRHHPYIRTHVTLQAAPAKCGARTVRATAMRVLRFFKKLLF